MKVSVPQQDGEIVLTDIYGPKTYAVSGGQVDVDDADVEHFLLVVSGSSAAAPAPLPSSPLAPNPGASITSGSPAKETT